MKRYILDYKINLQIIHATESEEICKFQIALHYILLIAQTHTIYIERYDMVCIWQSVWEYQCCKRDRMENRKISYNILLGNSLSNVKTLIYMKDS